MTKQSLRTNLFGVGTRRTLAGALMCGLLLAGGCKKSSDKTVGAGALPTVPVIYEGFDYVTGQPLKGCAGGIGLARSWDQGGYNARASQNYQVNDGSLEYPNLLVSGNHVSSTNQSVISGLARPLGYLIGVDNTRRYLSFLLRPELAPRKGAFSGFFGLSLMSSSDITYGRDFAGTFALQRQNARGSELFVGRPGRGSINTFVLEDRGGRNQISSAAAVTAGQTALMVVRMDFSTRNDTFTLFVNPVVGQPEPTNGVTKTNLNLGIVDRLVLYSTGAFSIDEIRIGDTYESVTPVRD